MATGPNAIPAIGSRRELFVDDFLIDGLNGARLKLHEPKPGGVAVRYDTPWEGYPDLPLSFYTTVLKDGDTYRMYYRGSHDPLIINNCYAESVDGVSWSKPRLGLVDVGGSTANNVILLSGRLCPFIDGRPGVPAAERYKASVLGVDPAGKVGLFGYVSSDGVHWTKLRDELIVSSELENYLDSQNVMFWSEAEECYVLFARHMVGGRRATARSTSDDFVNWTGPTLMTYSDTGVTTPSEHLYTNQTHPYFRAPHIYISLPGRILWADAEQVPRQDDVAAFRKHVITDELRRFYETNVHTRTGALGDVADGVLLTSRAGTTLYDFTFRESFVRPGIGLNNWTSRNNYPALGVVQTGPTEMSLYVQRDYGQKTSHLERMTLRLDGFTSLNAPYEGGDMTTKPFTFDGDELEMNYSTSAAGSIKVEVQDTNGSALPGYGQDDCRELIGDEIERVVAWERGSTVSGLAGKPVRLRFVMKDADVYSLRFRRAHH